MIQASTAVVILREMVADPGVDVHCASKADALQLGALAIEAMEAIIALSRGFMGPRIDVEPLHRGRRDTYRAYLSLRSAADSLKERRDG